MPQFVTHPPAGFIAHEQIRSVLAGAAPTVRRAVQAAVLSAADLRESGENARRARQRGEPYAREVVYRSEGAEVLLAWWWAGARCAPHDHGGAQGSVLVLRGHFEERCFVFDGAGLHRTARRELLAGECIEVGPDAIHEMSALDEGVTLHVYTASSRRMRVYDATSRTTWLIREDEGAWLPGPNALQDAQPWTSPGERR